MDKPNASAGGKTRDHRGSVPTACITTPNQLSQRPMPPGCLYISLSRARRNHRYTVLFRTTKLTHPIRMSFLKSLTSFFASKTNGSSFGWATSSASLVMADYVSSSRRRNRTAKDSPSIIGKKVQLAYKYLTSGNRSNQRTYFMYKQILHLF